MDWRLILEYIRVLIWPAVALTLGIIFRSQLGGLVRRIESVETPIGNATFRSQTEAIAEEAREVEQEISADLKNSGGAPPAGEKPSDPESSFIVTPTIDRDLVEFDSLLDVAQSSPTAAVMAAWREIESSIRQGLTPTPGTSGGTRIHEALREAARRGLLPSELVRSANDLRALRNTVAHGADIAITAKDAISYIVAAQRVTTALITASKSLTSGSHYEKAIFRTLLQWDFPVERLQHDEGCDFYVGSKDGLVGVLIKYSHNFARVDVARLKEELPSSIVPVVVVTNASLDDAALMHNRSRESRNSTALAEIVHWRSTADDDVLIRALLRAGAKA
jgi:hypothetical protein